VTTAAKRSPATRMRQAQDGIDRWPSSVEIGGSGCFVSLAGSSQAAVQLPAAIGMAMMSAPRSSVERAIVVSNHASL
jgi:hypothetical protein